MVYLSAILMLAVLIGGGLSYGANKAPPGSLLYQYKLTINEPLEEFLANTDQSKAQLDLSLMKERLRDARILALEGSLDATAQTAINNDITHHVKNLTATFAKMQAGGEYTDAATLAAQLYKTLRDETAKIADVGAQGSTNVQLALAPVLVKLRTTMATVSLISTSAQARAAGINAPLPSAATIQGAVESK